MQTKKIYSIFLAVSITFVFNTSQAQQNSKDLKPQIEYGDNFIVFEANAGDYDKDYWILRTPEDAEYEKYITAENKSNISAINNNYLEYTGEWKDPSGKSDIRYTFTCQNTGDYQLAARLYQPLKAGEKGDACNDFFVRMEGDFTSAGEFKTEALRKKEKFWGRGVNAWGTAQYLEAGPTNFPIYHLSKDKTYTIILSGRSARACIDYLLLFKTELKLGVGNEDLAAQNETLYRPGGPRNLMDKVARIVFETSNTYLAKVNESKQIKHMIFPSKAKNRELIWTSSDENIVKVDKQGRMTAIRKGEAIITAKTKDGSVRAQNKMKVGEYIETFDNYISYKPTHKSFIGDNTIIWNISGRNTSRMNNTNAVLLGKNLAIVSNKISGGITAFKVECKALYKEELPRTLELYINEELKGSATNKGASSFIFEVKDLNIKGEFTIKLKNATKSEKGNPGVMIDNLVWTPLD